MSSGSFTAIAVVIEISQLVKDWSANQTVFTVRETVKLCSLSHNIGVVG